jgi:hypothetical protein
MSAAGQRPPPPGGLADDLAILEEAAAEPDETRVYRVRRRRRDGREVVTEQRVRRITDEAGRLSAIVGVCRPVTPGRSECISRLRAKLEPDPHRPRLLLTERGLGYRLARTPSGDGLTGS